MAETSDIITEGASKPIDGCPECGSKRLWLDGPRKLSDGSSVQRWLCRDCGYRFSESPKRENNAHIMRQVCAQNKGAKNLEPVAENKTVTGGKSAVRRNIDLISEEARGLLTKYMAYLEREGFSEDTEYPRTLSHLVKDGANLLNPENVKSVIAQQRKKNGEPWTDSMKMLATYAYDAFCQMQGIVWKKPTYHQNEATVPVPDEKDLDLLISRARKKLATFMQCLKETFADPSEILKCDWIDLNGNVLSINHPVKGHYPGKYELKPQLVSMLNALPRKNKRIFPTTYKTIYHSLLNLRTKAAEEFQKPELLRISFKSFRHWGGTMLAYVTNGNVPVMARKLRHKSWRSTQKYVHNVEFREEDYEETVATTPEEIRALGKAGWTKYDEATFNGIQMHFYRKPKRFGSFKKGVDKSEKQDDKFLCTA
jgi:integrase